MEKVVKKREDISALFTDEKAISEYLHGKKRGKLSLFLRLFEPIIKDKKLLFLYGINAIFGGLIPIISAFTIWWLVDRISMLPQKENYTLEEVLPYLLGILGFSLLLFFLELITTQIPGRVNAKITHFRLEALRKIFVKTTEMDYAITEDARVQQAFGNYIGSMSYSSGGMEGIFVKVLTKSKFLVSFLILSCLLFRVHFLLPFLGLLSIFVFLVSDNLFSKHYEEMKLEKEKLGRRTYSVLSEASDFSYGKDIRVFSMGEAFQKLLFSLFRKEKNLNRRTIGKRFVFLIPKSMAIFILNLGIFYFVGKEYELGNILLPDFVMVLSVVGIYVVQILGLGELIRFVSDELVNMNFYYDVLDAKLSSEGGEELLSSDFGSLDIEFKDVWFRYPNSERWVLEGINLTIKEGESLALVGVNGAGKSTLTNLLNGLFVPTKGVITIGGIDITYLSKNTLKRLVTTVFQDFEPVAMTVKENVAAVMKEKHEIDEERVKEVLRQAGLYEKINSFPKGINSTLLRVMEDDGMVLSGGENQKLSIARALYKKETGILILDEPTAALDALAEEKIYREFETLTKGKSSLFISHRLASTRFCDRIALLDGGKIKETGSHEELLNRNGVYKEMFMVQASFYKEGQDEE